MFVRKLVEKASLKKPGGISDGLKPSDVNPHLVFHYGIPAGSTLLAYDSVQRILAVSTSDGRIKLFGRGNTQALLESDESVSSKFLQFIENLGILLRVTVKNQIEVWDLETKKLSHLHVSGEEVSSFTVMQQSLYMYVGYSSGNVSVLKLDQEQRSLIQQKYTIPFSASHGNPDVAGGAAVTQILLQPMAKSKRILIIFRDGIIVLWEVRESKPIFLTGGSMLPSIGNETRKVTSACWACSFGSKVVVGYNNGEILIWSIPYSPRFESAADREKAARAPICKLNLGFKTDKTPIASLVWTYADGKVSRLYVMGASDSASANSLQVLLLNEHTESRTIKLGLHLPEPCFDMEVISGSSGQIRNKTEYLLLLGKSGHIYLYDDHMIEKYLVQSQSRTPPSLPKEVIVKLPFSDTAVTVTKLIADDPSFLSTADKEYISLTKNAPPLLPIDFKQKDGTPLNFTPFSGFAKIRKLLITGHSNGAINLWEVTSPLLLPLISLRQQSEDDFSLSGIAITSLHYDGTSRLLISGDQSGMVRIYQFKPEQLVPESSFMSLHGSNSTKKGSNQVIHSIKLIKVNGATNFIGPSYSKHFAVGTDEGYVSVIDIDGPNILYQKHIVSELCMGIVSLQYKTCILHGFEKNVLVVATKDSSLFVLDGYNGNALSASTVQPKKPYRALFLQVLDAGLRGNTTEDALPKPSSLLLCSEKAAYVYSLEHVVQGVKKVHYKKKFSSSCCWASTFTYSCDSYLVLIFTSGKIETRSLPDLCLLKETTEKGLSVANTKLDMISGWSICSSRDGEIIMVKGDQEILFFSVLLRKEISRILESVGQIYHKDSTLEEGRLSGPLAHKEKKQGIFNSVFKDLGGKTKHVPKTEADDVNKSIEELSMIFSVANFISDTKNRDGPFVVEEDVELSIDDIDLGDPLRKPKEQNMMAALNKENLASKFQAFKGKLKLRKVKNEKIPMEEREEEDEKAGKVDEIKKRYGFSASGETTVAKMVEGKLNENLKKLKGISQKTTAMNDTAKSFSFMAKQVLRTAEQDKANL